MARTGAYTYSDEELQKLSGTDWASGIGTGAASGAMAGSAAGPWGTLVGGALGGIAGAIGTGEQEAQYLEAQRQQQAVEKELQDRSYIEGLMTDANIARAGRERAAMTESEFAANRLGLTGQGAGMLQENTRHNLAVEDASTRGDIYRQANEMEAQRQGRVMDKYQFQQALAQNAMAGSGDTLQALGAAAGSIGKLATMTQETPAPVNDYMMGGTQTNLIAPAYEGTTSDQVASSMSKLSAADQVAISQQYPEAFGMSKFSDPTGPYQDPYSPYGDVPTSPNTWSAPVEQAAAAAQTTDPAPATGPASPGKPTGRAASAPPAGGRVVTAPRTVAPGGASQAFPGLPFRKPTEPHGVLSGGAGPLSQRLLGRVRGDGGEPDVRTARLERRARSGEEPGLRCAVGSGRCEV